MRITSFEEFKELARRGTFVPVVKELVADLLTPVSAFLKIAEDADYAFLLESVEGGEHVGRYSFLGKDPFLILRARGGRTTIGRGPAADGIEVRSTHAGERVEERVRKAKDHVAAGDIYQVVLSQRFEADIAADPFTVYRALRHVNPSPYMYFIRMGEVSVVGS